MCRWRSIKLRLMVGERLCGSGKYWAPESGKAEIQGFLRPHTVFDSHYMCLSIPLLPALRTP